jgi:tetratricopeptide (TPR) repeat protein
MWIALLAVGLLSLTPAPAEAQMDMLPQIFRDLPPELQQGIPDTMEYSEYRRLNRNVDFFTMFMAGVVPGYAHFQVEKPRTAWAIVGTRLAGYAMMTAAVARQWQDWRDLRNLDSIPDDRYQRYQQNLFLFVGGVAVNGMAWAFDVIGAYHIAKEEKDFVIYKYGLRESVAFQQEELEIDYIRRLILQDDPDEWQVRQDLRRSLLGYIETYPEGSHRGEVEFYLGSLSAEEGESVRALLHYARNLFLFPDERYSPAARRDALAILQRHRSDWPADWSLLMDMFEGPMPPEVGANDYLRAFQRLRTEVFQHLYVEEAKRMAAENPGASYADDALFGAARQLESLGEIEAAVVAYTQLAGLYPSSEHWAPSVFRTAELLSLLGEPEYARRFYERLIRVSPESPQADGARQALRD